MLITLGTLQEIDDLRTIWQEGSKDFTEWLAKEDNINILAQAAGLEMSAEETHSPVGKLHADILASESGTNRRIIIISNFSETDDSGLGRLITLAAGKNADVVIWIVRHANDEYKAAKFPHTQQYWNISVRDKALPHWRLRTSREVRDYLPPKQMGKGSPQNL